MRQQGLGLGADQGLKYQAEPGDSYKDIVRKVARARFSMMESWHSSSFMYMFLSKFVRACVCVSVTGICIHMIYMLDSFFFLRY